MKKFSEKVSNDKICNCTVTPCTLLIRYHLVLGYSKSLAVPPNFSLWGDGKIFLFVPTKLCAKFPPMGAGATNSVAPKLSTYPVFLAFKCCHTVLYASTPTFFLQFYKKRNSNPRRRKMSPVAFRHVSFCPQLKYVRTL